MPNIQLLHVDSEKLIQIAFSVEKFAKVFSQINAFWSKNLHFGESKSKKLPGTVSSSALMIVFQNTRISKLGKNLIT